MNQKIIGFFLLSVVNACAFLDVYEKEDIQLEQSSKRLVKFSVHVEEQIKAVKSKWVGSIKYPRETKDEAQLQLTKNMDRVQKFLIDLGFESSEIFLKTTIVKNKKIKKSGNPYGSSADEQEEEKWTSVLAVTVDSKKVDLINDLASLLAKKLEITLSYLIVSPSFDNNNLDLEFKLLEMGFDKVDSMSKKIALLMRSKVKKIHRAKWAQIRINGSLNSDPYSDPYASPGRASMKNEHIATASLVLNIALELDS